MSGLSCPRCGRGALEQGSVLCADCHAALVPQAGRSASSRSVQLTPILLDALAQVQPGEDFDEALLRALKAHQPGDAPMLLPALSRLIAQYVERNGGSREEAARRLAEASLAPELTVSVSGSRYPTLTSVTETRVVRVGERSSMSSEDLPPEARRAMETGLKHGGRPRVRVGCSTALLLGLFGAFLRRG